MQLYEELVNGVYAAIFLWCILLIDCWIVCAAWCMCSNMCLPQTLYKGLHDTYQIFSICIFENFTKVKKHDQHMQTYSTLVKLQKYAHSETHVLKWQMHYHCSSVGNTWMRGVWLDHNSCQSLLRVDQLQRGYASPPTGFCFCELCYLTTSDHLHAYASWHNSNNCTATL